MKPYNNVVIKIGSSILSTKESPYFCDTYLTKLVDDIANVHREGKKVSIVSSGAILCGAHILGRPRSLAQKQATAAVGQVHLMTAYRKLFSKYNIEVGQILVCYRDFMERYSYLNILHTITMLYKHNIIPIINENDSVAVDEIKFGDNDTLAAHVANLINADLLVFLTDTAGMYIDGKLCEFIEDITEEMVESASYGKRGWYTTGGLRSKLVAARLATRCNIYTVIADGREDKVVSRIIHGERIGTLFAAKKAPAAKQRWLLTIQPIGKLYVDAGAKRAIVEEGKSLLAAGIVEVVGDFSRSDVVGVYDETDMLIAKGLCNYSFYELTKIKGHPSCEFPSILGYIRTVEVIHRNDMVIMQ